MDTPGGALQENVSASNNRNIYLFNRAGGRSIVDHQTVDQMLNLIQWQGSLKHEKDRLGKSTGTGVSPAAFWSLFRRGKSDPGCGAGEAPHVIDQNGSDSGEEVNHHENPFCDKGTAGKDLRDLPHPLSPLRRAGHPGKRPADEGRFRLEQGI